MKKSAAFAVTVFLLSVVPSERALPNEAIWIEGEDYTTSTFVETQGAGTWYHNDNLSKHLLSPGKPGVSDGDWHSHYTSNDYHDSGTATYTLTVAEGGSYSWWIRLNPFRNRTGGADYSYSIDNGPWQAIDLSYVTSRLDLVDPGIDIRFIAWTFGDVFDLAAGPHTLKVRISDRDGADKDGRGGIDVMAFTNFPWAPTGVVRPDPNPPAPRPDDWFMLMAGPDQHSPDSIIDMSRLIEKPAGTRGFLKRQGKDFVFEDGPPVKFWGVDAGMSETIQSQHRQARFYAKHGINMVRQHPVQSVLGLLKSGGRTPQFDPARLDRWDRWFSILKDKGIYMTWSLFYPHVITEHDSYPADLYNELPNRGAGKSTSGVVTMMRELQNAEWQWEQTLLEHVNPYTELAYKDDPALAIVEVHNEDSIFWHAPLNDLASYNNGKLDRHAAILGTMWMNWLKNRYDNDTNLKSAWGSGMKSGDSVGNPSMKMYAAWEMQGDGPRSNKNTEKKRMGDFIRFLAELQRDYYERREQRLRELGYKAVTVTTAWKAGGPAASAANLWTDDVMDAIDRHNYFGGGAGGHNITTGPVSNDTHLSKAGRGILSSGFWQVEDKPFVMTEWTQKPPNQWKAEIAPLFAFYGMGLQGWDASYHFAASRSYMGNGWPSMRSYVTCTPHYLGQFPALAFAIYNNHFVEGDITSARRPAASDIFAGIDKLGQKHGLVGYDQNELLAHGDTPVEALAIGRVTLKVEDGQEPSYLGNLSDYWDRRAKVIRSNTGQLTWDYGGKVVTVHSDKTQGIIGFAGGGKFDLPGVTVEVGATPFVSLLFTPLDNRALIESGHVLITALAQDKQHGTVYSGDGMELIETGGPPLFIEPVQATLTFKGAPLTSVKVVDVYGVPTAQQVEHNGNTFSINGRYATYYYQVKRAGE
ncbi:MAG: hypothetical protein CEE38_05260 [Planctomycetes bacterium B3_Pla]|nr:MAG: hypothetical protein CEE38_05260 [Planctomycetes bacterium B3_Pla]